MEHGNWQMNLYRHAAGEEITLRSGDRLAAASALCDQRVLRKEGATYHYRESGLDNVYLENGYRKHKTAYGEGVSIIDTEGLHKVIGQTLICAQRPLNGAELRFLRIEMETTQKDPAGMLGTSEQTLRLWEKDREVPPRFSGSPPPDHVLRLCGEERVRYVECCGGSRI